MTYNIAFFADSHVGYRAKVGNNEKGINIRVQDGYDAFRETLDQIVKSDIKIDAVVHGGDLFHESKPTMRDITTVQHYLRLLAKRGIPFYGLAGNHDATDIRAEIAAVAPVNDPDKGIFALYEPYAKYELTDGLVLHSVSHHGLANGDAPKIEASSDVVNIFTTHGAALDPKNQELMHCEGSPREQMIPVDLILDDTFAVKLLGHYHSRYAVGGEILNTWYSGSAVRRGFSDSPGARGWLLVQVEENGEVTVSPRNIKQRPQYDLDIIDAEGMNSNDVMDLLELNMNRTKEAEKAPIVRQKIINAPRSVREGMDRLKIGELSEHMLDWNLKITSPEVTKTTSSKRDLTLKKGSINIIDHYKEWAKAEAANVPEEFREAVLHDVEKYLKTAREIHEH
jgi:exonuclease SbcD